MTGINIALVEHCSPELLKGIRTLMPVLSLVPPPTEIELDEIIRSPTTRLFIATDGDDVVGMLTLVLVRISTGLRAHIEDVAVLESHQRQGLGRALMIAAINMAKSAGARTIDLTSRSSRAAAIHLYESLGFRKRDTSVFRYSI